MKKLLIFICIFTACFMTACGKKDEKLEEYFNQMTDFTDEVQNIGECMDMVDPYEEGAEYEMLGYLDEMENQFKTLSEMEVPKEFSSNEGLADEAYEYMQIAVSGFHEFYEDSSSSYSTFEIAKENYNRALKRVDFISTILQGELPNGENVEITEEDNTDFNPVTE